MSSVKFIIDSDLTELVDAIGCDYVESKDENEIIVTVDDIDELVSDVNSYNELNDDELCSFLLNETISEALIYTDRSRI